MPPCEKNKYNYFMPPEHLDRYPTVKVLPSRASWIIIWFLITSYIPRDAQPQRFEPYYGTPFLQPAAPRVQFHIRFPSSCFPLLKTNAKPSRVTSIEPSFPRETGWRWQTMADPGVTTRYFRTSSAPLALMGDDSRPFRFPLAQDGLQRNVARAHFSLPKPDHDKRI